MKENNLKLYESLSSQVYLKSDNRFLGHFKILVNYPGIIGFDDQTGGFLVIHKNHCAAALSQELPVCVFLKQMGLGVILLEEPTFSITPDARISDREFEIKRISRSRNINTAVFYQFRTAYRKSPNLLLHIDQEVNPESLRNALYTATKHYSQNKLVWVVYALQLWQFERNSILKGKHQFFQRK